MKKITTLEELKAECKDGGDFFILLNGNLRSSKHICWDEKSKQFEVLNEIDDTEQCLSETEIMNPNSEETNIGKAISMGAFIKY
jgi:hypothetical protein